MQHTRKILTTAVHIHRLYITVQSVSTEKTPLFASQSHNRFGIMIYFEIENAFVNYDWNSSSFSGRCIGTEDCNWATVINQFPGYNRAVGCCAELGLSWPQKASCLLPPPTSGLPTNHLCASVRGAGGFQQFILYRYTHFNKLISVTLTTQKGMARDGVARDVRNLPICVYIQC